MRLQTPRREEIGESLYWINKRRTIVLRWTLDEDEMWNKLERLYKVKSEVEAEIVGFNGKRMRFGCL
ncbi:MAG: hypothetical protein ACTS4W_00395 [Candidatus Hodgkinia cicadicola]